MMKSMIAMSLACMLLGTALVGCEQQNDGTEETASTVSEENTTAAETIETETTAEETSDEPINQLSIRRGINISTYEYVGMNKELHLGLRGGVEGLCHGRSDA